MCEDASKRQVDCPCVSPKGDAIFLCDRTGNMAEPWADAGYRCWCIDIQHSIRKPRRVGNIWFIWGDARSWLPEGLDIRFVAAFPVCTHMTVADARDFKVKGLPFLIDGLSLFHSCIHAAAWSGAPYCVENPKGVISTHFRPADFKFNPCDYGGYLKPHGDAYTKETWLWTGNGFVMPEPKPVPPVEGSKMHRLAPSENRADLRSETPKGFARAVFLANAPHLRRNASGFAAWRGR